MKLKNLLALILFFSLQSSCMELGHSAQTSTKTHFEKLALDNYNQMNADMNILEWGKNSLLCNIFNARQRIREPHPLSFNYSELDLESFKRIIRVNPNTKDVYGIPPLYWACCTNNLETIQSLLSNTHTMPNTLINGRTVLHIASEWGKVEIVKSLLNNDKTDPNKKTAWGSTALDIARNKGRTEIIELLLAHPNIQENTDNIPDSNSDLTDQNIMTIEDTISYEDTDDSGRAQLVRLLLKSYKNTPDIKKLWNNTELKIARNKRLTKIKQLFTAHQNTQQNNHDTTLENAPINNDTTYVAPKKIQKNWLHKKIIRQMAALYQACCKSITNYGLYFSYFI